MISVRDVGRAKQKNATFEDDKEEDEADEEEDMADIQQ